MKTIEEGLNEAYEKAGSNAYFGNGFKAGVEFAQRWISVEEQEKPINDSKNLLLVKVDGTIYLSTYFNNSFFLSNVTHWRPIEYK